MAAAPVVRRLGLPFWHPAVLLATWFGAGLLPVTPGSWGSLAALPFAWWIDARWGAVGLLAGSAVVFAVGCWAAGVINRASGVKDAGAIVIDEVAAQWVVLTVAPRHPLAYLAGFLLFRVADILKPWPASWADSRVGGGFGVMIDDIIAALYAASVLAVLVALWSFLSG
jgi:phosphatidylglycerophosphatase A